MTGVKANLRI